MRGIFKLTSYKKPFSRENSAIALKPAINFSQLLFSKRFVRLVGEMNIQGDNSVEYCI
jgi:hypothetical protein